MEVPQQTDAVRPVSGFPRPSKDMDIEKNPNDLHEASSDVEKKSLDSENFQNGVQRVRAITEIWGKKTLITMFVLYVDFDPVFAAQMS